MYCMSELEESFIATLRREIDSFGYGAQTKLAEKLSVSRQHLNDIIGERKTAGKRLQERIAKEYGFTYENFLAIGRMIIEGQSEEEIEKTASILRKRPGTHQATNSIPIGAQQQYQQAESRDQNALLHIFKELNHENQTELLMRAKELETHQYRQAQRKKQEPKE